VAQGNLKLVERLYERWNARDLEGCVAMHHPEFEMVTSGTFPDLDRVYEGPQGFRRFWNDFYGIWERLVITTRELVEHDDQVMALWIFEGEGRDGVEVRREGAHLVRFRDGLVTRIEVYGSWVSARAAAKQQP
jgi:ketosteroid isomerase-like protein